MITIYAPYPSVQTVMLLPNPLFGNTDQIGSQVTYRQSMNNEDYSYIKRGKRIFTYGFEVERKKYLEVMDFWKYYISVRWKITDHENRNIIGLCKTNPLEGTGNRRGEYAMGEDQESVDVWSFQFEFIGSIV